MHTIIIPVLKIKPSSQLTFDQAVCITMSNSTLNGKQERKKLRKAQREVSDQMIVDKDELDKPDSDVWNIHRNRNNELKEKVLHARELLNDSQNVKALAQSVQNAAGHLDDISRRYDFTSFAASLTRQYNSGTTGLFSWVGFGQDVGVLSRRRECLCTMFGPVGKCFPDDDTWHQEHLLTCKGNNS